MSALGPVMSKLCCDGMAWFSRWRIKSRDPLEYERMMKRRKRKPYLDITKRFINVVNSYVKREAVTATRKRLVATLKPSVNLKTSIQMQNPTVAESKETESLFDRDITPRRRRSMINGSSIHPSTMVNADNQGAEDVGTGTSHVETLL